MRNDSASIYVQVAAGHPLEQLAPALEAVLAELQREGGANLTVDLAADLEAPVEMSLAVPVSIDIAKEAGTNEFEVRISPRTKQHFYPGFRGVLRMTPARADSCVVALRGRYTPPLGALGKHVDMTFLRGTARSSLKRFLARIVEQASKRVPAIEKG